MPESAARRIAPGDRAIIFNNYLETGGGGERSSFDYALALKRLGLRVQMAIAQSSEFDYEALKFRFGLTPDIELDLLEFPNEDALADYVRRERIPLFVNHSFCSYLPNPAPLGIYVVMFPYQTSAENVEAIETYQSISCISGFTEQHMLHRWGKGLPSVVIPPPISEVHTRAQVTFAEKEPIVLNVGRFNVFGHSKCQLEAIETFVDLTERGVLDSTWRLVVAGHVNRNPESEQYVVRCRQAAERANVEVLTNISFNHLQHLYRRATALWQFTGLHLPYGEKPEHCEHLGLVAMDCLAYGVVPICYERSGAAQLIEHGKTGFVFSELAEVESAMRLLSDHRGRQLHQKLFRQLRNAAHRFSAEYFTESVANLIHVASEQPRTEFQT